MKNKAVDLIQYSKEQAEGLVNKNIKFIKKFIKSKMKVYPLNFKMAFKNFVEEIKANDYEMIRGMPAECAFETYLESLIKKFLIKESYFSLEEECIQKRIQKALKNPDKNDLKYLEMRDFITMEIEKNDLEKLNKFREEARFQNYLNAIVGIQMANYWRLHFKIKGKIEKYGPELTELYNIDKDDPLTRLIGSEAEEIKEKIAEALNRKRLETDAKEWVAFDMFYYEDASLSAIAGTLKTSSYKVKKMIRRRRDSILSEVQREIE